MTAISMPIDTRSASPPADPTPDALTAALGRDLGPGLHEIHAASVEEASALGFAAMLAARRPSNGTVVWLTEGKGVRGSRLYGLGLAELSLDPDRMLLVPAPDTIGFLRAGREALSCAAVAAVILHSRGALPALDLTASRRLHLAAIANGVPAFCVRIGASAAPSAASTR